MIENGLNLKQVHKDRDSEFFIGKGIKMGSGMKSKPIINQPTTIATTIHRTTSTSTRLSANVEDINRKLFKIASLHQRNVRFSYI
jgi:hypothetical protein